MFVFACRFIILDLLAARLDVPSLLSLSLFCCSYAYNCMCCFVSEVLFQKWAGMQGKQSS